MDELAYRIKNHYVKLRQRAQRITEYRPSDARCGKLWQKASDLCRRFKIVPEEFVEVQFEALKPWPQINCLGSQGALNRYENKREDYARKIALQVSMQLAQLEAAIESGKDACKYLVDNEFDALFQFLMLREHGCEEAENYRERAYNEYMICGHYARVYKTRIPNEWRNTND